MSIPIITLQTNEKVTASLQSILGNLVTTLRERDLPAKWTVEPAGFVELVPLNSNGTECDIEGRRAGSAQVKAQVGELTAFALVNVVKRGANYMEIKFGPVAQRVTND